MAPVPSSGLLLHRAGPDGCEVLIGHMGGPFWATKDDGAWSIPKGERDPGEEPLAVALREFAEEMGGPAPEGPTVLLGDFRQSNGKVVTVFARQADFDASEIRSNTFEMEWPPRSGRSGRLPRDRPRRVDDARRGAAEAREGSGPGARRARDAGRRHRRHLSGPARRQRRARRPRPAPTARSTPRGPRRRRRRTRRGCRRRRPRRRPPPQRRCRTRRPARASCC